MSDILAHLCQCGCGQVTKLNMHLPVPHPHRKFLKGHNLRTGTLEERFWAMVINNGKNKCWGWKGSKRGGYARIAIRNGVGANASRVSWELHFGFQIPKGLLALHTCDHPECTNPKHLFLGTNSDNAKDKAAKGRSYRMSGEDHPLSKVTESEVLEIRRLLANGMEQRPVAKMFGISQSAVWCISSGKTWKHI